MSKDSASLFAVHGGDLTLGNGLLALIRPSLYLLEVGGRLSVHSTNPDTREDLPRWCQIEHHRYVECQKAEGGDLHVIERGKYPAMTPANVSAIRLESVGLDEIQKQVPFPETASSTTGFAPRGADVERGGPTHDFPIHESALAASSEVAALYDQAVKNQWSAQTDIPWEKLKPLPAPLDWALSQVMTFLAENELSALYLPSRFVSKLHPYYMESGMYLATQLMDEARHIEVFMKRAWACGGRPGISSVVTQTSLLSLLKARDFLESSFLLSVLGEGTFIDLLSFIEKYAPDEVTELIMHKAKQDESRHVHFGMAHVAHALKARPVLKKNLQQAVERRAADLASITGAPSTLQDGLVLLAAGSDKPQDLKKGHDAYRELLETMKTNRVKRLKTAGFTTEEAKHLSELHTPNFM